MQVNPMKAGSAIKSFFFFFGSLFFLAGLGNAQSPLVSKARAISIVYSSNLKGIVAPCG